MAAAQQVVLTMDPLLQNISHYVDPFEHSVGISGLAGSGWSDGYREVLGGGGGGFLGVVWGSGGGGVWTYFRHGGVR